MQTAEGALTEVHAMLQRMNELAVQAANGTNSESDRTALQNEISQLTTEIDRVAETTKFNETYLLKGDVDGSTKNVYLNGHDAGIKGEFGATNAANVVNGVATDGLYTLTVSGIAAGNTINIGGVEYTLADDADGATTDAAKALHDNKKITLTEAGKMIANELTKANMIGTDAKFTDNATNGIYDTGTFTAATNGTAVQVNPATASDGKLVFSITAAQVVPEKALSFNLHVGADADMTNKIGVDIETMNSTYLGIKGLNVVGPSNDNGITATYAIDAIADAVQKVSDQRSALGAIQNRLEHTIANVDNVVENTTAAESRIRDTDMASEMVTYSKNNILAQAGQSMLAQANQSTQGVMSLLG